MWSRCLLKLINFRCGECECLECSCWMWCMTLNMIEMESQMVQNSRSRSVFTFNEFFIKVKRDFNQAHQNQVTFNGFSFKVTAYFNQAQQQKLTHSTNFNSARLESIASSSRNELSFLSTKSFVFLSFRESFDIDGLYYNMERRNARMPARRNAGVLKLLKPRTHEKYINQQIITK